MGKESPELIHVAKPEKKSLLQRYEIPVEHLSYEYISECTNSTALERIILILRSGEEGIYPDLIKHAEKRLLCIKPNSTVLRKAEPVLTRNMLALNERNEIEDDISQWMSEMQCREKDLEDGKAGLLSDSYPQPDIRQIRVGAAKKAGKPQATNTTKAKRISSCDYDAWSKYDVDTEINKIDIQDEQRRIQIKNKQQKQKVLSEKRNTKDVLINKSSLTATELNVMADQEREKGNEAFRAGDYKEALQHYNLSVKINSNLAAYNNRAMTYIKLQRYDDALNDCNVVLSMEYTNIKALLRRALSLEHLEKSSQAFADYEAVLKLDPSNKQAIAGIKKLGKPCQSRKVRMVIEEKYLNEDERTANDESASGDCVEKNSFSLETQKIEKTASGICFCDRAPGPSQIVKPRPHFKADYCLENDNVQLFAHKTKSVHSSKLLTRKTKSDTCLRSNNTMNLSNSPGISSASSDIINRVSRNLNLKSTICRKSNYKVDSNQSSVIIEELPPESCNNININKTYAPEQVKNNNDDNKEDWNEKQTVKNEKVAQSVKETKDELSNVVLNSKNRTSSSLKKIQASDKLENKTNKLKVDNSEKPVINSPYEFMRQWHALKNDDNYKLHAELLKSLNKDKLTTVLGMELDGIMFNTIVNCLEQYFCSSEETELLITFLRALSRANRFSIVNMFMNTEDKKALRNIFCFLEARGVSEVSELRKVYCV